MLFFLRLEILAKVFCPENISSEISSTRFLGNLYYIDVL